MALHTLNIRPKIITSIASLYNDTNRIFMEYIDNSLDSAEEYYDSITNSYIQNVMITIELLWNEYRDWKVIISDNCTWVKNFPKLVENIGYSDKTKWEKSWKFTNWQFGFGIYSFIAACEKLSINSKTINHESYFIKIEREQFKKERQEDVIFEINQHNKMLNILWKETESGTIIELSGFDKHMFKQIDFDEIQSEIERHFELLLHRKNLEIKLIRNNIEYICKPFDYSDLEWEEFNFKTNELHYEKIRKYEGRKYLDKEIFQTEKPLHVYLKVIKGKVSNKLPVFISKWRRIAEVKNINAFSSKHKGDIWGHPNITWYIDLPDGIEPTIARNDFKNTDRTKALFNTIEELEPQILDLIRNINKESEEKHYQALEDELNKALSKLAKIDSMNYRTEYLSWDTINLKPWWSWQSIEEWFWQKDRWDKENKNKDGWNFWENAWDGSWPSWNEWNTISGWEKEWSFASNKEMDNPFEDSEFKWWEKKKSWFNIRIVDIEPPIDENNKPKRSQLIWSEIRIFKEHPDFLERLEINESWRGRKWWLKVTQRLITYLAGQITIHYKDTLQTRYWQPEYKKELFDDLVEFIYKFEGMLKDLGWMNLSDFTDLT